MPPRANNHADSTLNAPRPHHVPADLDGDAETVIRRNLAGFERIAAPPGRSAAVVLCVLTGSASPHVLVIKRAARGLNPGQWALPGGRVEPGETPVTAALRELHEEIGLSVAEDRVAGALDDFVTGSGYVITPFVAVVPEPVELRRSPAEVHSIHRIPLRRLVSADLPRWTSTPDGLPLLQMPLRRNMIVHAPTGAILYQFREAALLGRPTRVADVHQPAFTRS